MEENPSGTMDSNKYETYDYLGDTEAGNDSENFFVVQENGTLFISKQVEYVNGVESCVYDVTQQPYYVDVNSSTELITVPDNFVLPPGENNFYANNFLLQSVPSTSTSEIDVAQTQDVNQCKTTTTEEANIPIENNEIRQSNNCTEITISDDQYNILEKEGWILLDVNGKVYILDTLGLHDVTNNKELIEQSRREIKTIQERLTNTKRDLVSPQISSTQPDTIEMVIDGNVQNVNDALNDIVVGNRKLDENGTNSTANNNSNSEDLITKLIHKEIDSENSSPIRLKTNLLIKDIPDRLELGTTVNGKKLIATFHKKKMKNSSNNSNSKQGNNHTLFEWQFRGLIKKNSLSENRCNAENLASIQDIISQLLMQDAFETAVIDQNLVITKTIKSKENEEENEVLLPWIVVGQVSNVDGQSCFVHKPDLLEQLVNNPESKEVTHLHIIETIVENNKNSEKISVTLRKRLLPACKVRRQGTTAFACTCCAKIFQSKDELMEHQEMLMETDDALTIDTDMLQSSTEDNAIVKPTPDADGKYPCQNCPMKFTKFSNFKKHSRSHFRKGENGVVKEPKYKCEICQSAYYYSSTLSKHIVTVHIKGSKKS